MTSPPIYVGSSPEPEPHPQPQQQQRQHYVEHFPQPHYHDHQHEAFGVTYGASTSTSPHTAPVPGSSSRSQSQYQSQYQAWTNNGENHEVKYEGMDERNNEERERKDLKGKGKAPPPIVYEISSDGDGSQTASTNGDGDDNEVGVPVSAHASHNAQAMGGDEGGSGDEEGEVQFTGYGASSTSASSTSTTAASASASASSSSLWAPARTITTNGRTLTTNGLAGPSAGGSMNASRSAWGVQSLWSTAPYSYPHVPSMSHPYPYPHAAAMVPNTVNSVNGNNDTNAQEQETEEETRKRKRAESPVANGGDLGAGPVHNYGFGFSGGSTSSFTSTSNNAANNANANANGNANANANGNANANNAVAGPSTSTSTGSIWPQNQGQQQPAKKARFSLDADSNPVASASTSAAPSLGLGYAGASASSSSAAGQGQGEGSGQGQSPVLWYQSRLPPPAGPVVPHHPPHHHPGAATTSAAVASPSTGATAAGSPTGFGTHATSFYGADVLNQAIIQNQTQTQNQHQQPVRPTQEALDRIARAVAREERVRDARARAAVADIAPPPINAPPINAPPHTPHAHVQAAPQNQNEQPVRPTAQEALDRLARAVARHQRVRDAVQNANRDREQRLADYRVQVFGTDDGNANGMRQLGAAPFNPPLPPHIAIQLPGPSMPNPPDAVHPAALQNHPHAPAVAALNALNIPAMLPPPHALNPLNPPPPAAEAHNFNSNPAVNHNQDPNPAVHNQDPNEDLNQRRERALEQHLAAIGMRPLGGDIARSRELIDRHHRQVFGREVGGGGAVAAPGANPVLNRLLELEPLVDDEDLEIARRRDAGLAKARAVAATSANLALARNHNLALARVREREEAALEDYIRQQHRLHEIERERHALVGDGLWPGPPDLVARWEAQNERVQRARERYFGADYGIDLGLRAREMVRARLEGGAGGAGVAGGAGGAAGAGAGVLARIGGAAGVQGAAGGAGQVAVRRPIPFIFDLDNVDNDDDRDALEVLAEINANIDGVLNDLDNINNDDDSDDDDENVQDLQLNQAIAAGARNALAGLNNDLNLQYPVNNAAANAANAQNNNVDVNNHADANNPNPVNNINNNANVLDAAINPAHGFLANVHDIPPIPNPGRWANNVVARPAPAAAAAAAAPAPVTPPAAAGPYRDVIELSDDDEDIYVRELAPQRAFGGIVARRTGRPGPAPHPAPPVAGPSTRPAANNAASDANVASTSAKAVDPIDAILASIIEVAPDVLPEYATTLARRHFPNFGVMHTAEHVLGLLFESKDYPKRVKGKGKGKNKVAEAKVEQAAPVENVQEDVPMDEEPDFLHFNPRMRRDPGPVYRRLARYHLRQSFPQASDAYINSANAMSYAHAHAYLTDHFGPAAQDDAGHNPGAGADDGAPHGRHHRRVHDTRGQPYNIVMRRNGLPMRTHAPAGMHAMGGPDAQNDVPIQRRNFLDAERAALRGVVDKAFAKERRWVERRYGLPKSDIGAAAAAATTAGRTAAEGVVVVDKGKAKDKGKGKAKEVDLVSEPVEEGTGVECQCCFAEYAFSGMAQCPDAHLFCVSCISQYAAVQLGNMNPSLTCMHADGCALPFTELELRRALPRKLMRLYERVLSQKAVEGLEGLESCPFCEWKCVIDVSPEVDRLFRCGNVRTDGDEGDDEDDEDCGAVSCRLCKKLDHTPKSCQEAEEDKHLDGQHAVEEAMTAALMRNCPKCKRAFIKEGGCNKMTCPSCGTHSCYTCRKEITGYNHFDQRPLDPGEPVAPGMCRTHDTRQLEEIHANEVKAAAEKALADYKAAHPDADDNQIKVDIPQAPPPPVRPQPAARLGAGGVGAINVLMNRIQDIPGVGVGNHDYQQIVDWHLARLGHRNRPALPGQRQQPLRQQFAGAPPAQIAAFDPLGRQHVHNILRRQLANPDIPLGLHDGPNRGPVADLPPGFAVRTAVPAVPQPQAAAAPAPNVLQNPGNMPRKQGAFAAAPAQPQAYPPPAQPAQYQPLPAPPPAPALAGAYYHHHGHHPAAPPLPPNPDLGNGAHADRFNVQRRIIRQENAVAGPAYPPPQRQQVLHRLPAAARPPVMGPVFNLGDGFNIPANAPQNAPPVGGFGQNGTMGMGRRFDAGMELGMGFGAGVGMGFNMGMQMGAGGGVGAAGGTRDDDAEMLDGEAQGAANRGAAQFGNADFNMRF